MLRFKAPSLQLEMDGLKENVLILQGILPWL